MKARLSSTVWLLVLWTSARAIWRSRGLLTTPAHIRARSLALMQLRCRERERSSFRRRRACDTRVDLGGMGAEQARAEAGG